jgi:DNA-binding winged helix-turn-helix (wHTH) protein
MQEANHSSRRLRFGVFEADLRIGELTKQGKRVPLQEQPFQLLARLLERPGELVSREELRARIWPQTIVDFDQGLSKAVSKIRDALGDSAENPRFIETVARRGYRFLADVAVVQDRPPARGAGDPALQADAGPLARPEAGISSRAPRRTLNWGLLSFGLALVFAAALSRIFYTSKDSGPTIRSLVSTAAEEPFRRRLAGLLHRRHDRGIDYAIGPDQRATRDFQQVGDALQRCRQALGRHCP